MNSWYSTLNRPPLTPPNWVFSPVWTFLYITIAISVILYYRSEKKPHMRLTSSVLIAHLFANFGWTYLFFSLRSPSAALVDVIFLDLSLMVLIVWFWESNTISGVILIPYLLWILFATYLNYGFYALN